jgi:hypothetical protein
VVGGGASLFRDYPVDSFSETTSMNHVIQSASINNKGTSPASIKPAVSVPTRMTHAVTGSPGVIESARSSNTITMPDDMDDPVTESDASVETSTSVGSKLLEGIGSKSFCRHSHFT